MKTKVQRERGEWGLTNICLDVVGLCRGALDVHAVAPGIVKFIQFHKAGHLYIAPEP